MRYALRDGADVWVRPVERDDAARLQHAFTLLSEVSRYQRFHTGLPVLGDQLADFLTDVDHSDHEALVAFPAEGSATVVGVARFVRDDRVPHEADLAFTIAEEWQGRGLATLLLQLLGDRARHEGISRFTLHMLEDNAGVLALVRAAGGEIGDARAGVVSGHIDIAGDGSAGSSPWRV